MLLALNPPKWSMRLAADTRGRTNRRWRPGIRSRPDPHASPSICRAPPVDAGDADRAIGALAISSTMAVHGTAGCPAPRPRLVGSPRHFAEIDLRAVTTTLTCEI